MTTSLYDLTISSSTGESINLGKFQGKPLLIINTASHCKFTPQYEDLQDLWLYFRNWDLNIIAIPSGDFGNQEFETNEEIRNFCLKRYRIDFILAQKSHVKGKQAIPLFQWLNKTGGYISKPRWNFYKYIISRQGKLSSWYSCLTRPSSKRFINAVERVAYDL